MGFFESAVGGSGARGVSRRLPVEMLRRHGCAVCPLDKVALRSPKMLPSGAANPLVYILGEAPGPDEDRVGEQFIGRAGRLLRANVPRRFVNKVRFNNSINCWPGAGNPDPTEVQTEACRGRIIQDIEQTKPPVLIGFGNYALSWATGQASRIGWWRGRRLPVSVGSHTCWLYPLMHPASILHAQDDEERGARNLEHVFELDMQRVFGEVERLPTPVVHTLADAKRDLLLIHGHEPGALDRVRDFLVRASKATAAGVDYETPCLRPYDNPFLLSIGVSFGAEALAFGVDHPQARWNASDKAELLQLWNWFLRCPVPKAVHFLGFELEWSAALFGRDVIRASRWHDTATEAAVMDERAGGHGREGPLSLGFLTLQHFGLPLKSLSHVDRAKLMHEPLSAVLPYNAMDSRYHLYLHEVQASLLIKAGKVPQYESMLERVPTCVLTQLKGVPTNLKRTQELAEKYAGQMLPLEAALREMPEVQRFAERQGSPYNPGSNPETLKLLRTELKVGVASADEAALKEINHPFAPALISWRKVQKRKATYVDSWMPGANRWPDGNLHPVFNTLFPETTRSSADHPNVQNVIKRDTEGKEVRQQIEAPEGYVIVEVDQGQIQARNIAMESRDPVYCKMLWEDYEIHGEWAGRLAAAWPDRVGGSKNLSDKAVMKTFRNDVKNKFTFPLFFGARDESVAGYLEMPVDIVSRECRRFWNIFTGVKDWQEDLLRRLREKGFVQSLEGFTRHAPLSTNQAINAPIQADEASIVFDGFNRLSKIGDPLYQANMEIHDSLVFFLPVKGLYDYVDRIVVEMLRCTFDWINVPLMVEVSIGQNWLEMEEVAKFRSDRLLCEPVMANRVGYA